MVSKESDMIANMGYDETECWEAVWGRWEGCRVLVDGGVEGSACKGLVHEYSEVRDAWPKNSVHD